MAYTLTIDSISPTSAVNTGNIGLVVNYTLSGWGIADPGFQISLYNALSGGTLVKTLYSDATNDLPNGTAITVTFSGVSPGTYYIDVYYKVSGSVRKEITITGQSSDIQRITLNGVTITVNKLNGNNIVVESLNSVSVYDTRPPLNTPQGSLIDKFDYDEGANNNGGVMLITINNTNSEGVILNGRILFGGSSDLTSEFTHFAEADGYFFGDVFPPNTSEMYGLCVIAQALLTSDWLYPVTVEVWFEPSSSSSTYRTSNKLIITVNS